MLYKRIITISFFLFTAVQLWAQDIRQIVVKDNTDAALPDVSVYDVKGKLIGKTDSKGFAQIKVVEFPIFFEKKGYSTRFAYTVKELSPMRMQKMGGEIPIVTIRDASKIIDSLLVLRDLNVPDFVNHDTTLYYRFHYELEYPNNKLGETAEGYLALNYKAIGATPSELHLYRYAYFIQFDYNNPNIDHFRNERMQSVNIMPLVIMLSNDMMSGFGYPLWEQLLKSYLEIHQRDWYFNVEQSGERVFSSYGTDEYGRLKEEITFDNHNKLEQIVLYTPEEMNGIDRLRFFDDFTKENGVNSFRTIYSYVKSSSNRVLSGMKHLSTFYEEGGMFYKMEFEMELVDKRPEEQFQIPAFYLSHNHYHPEQNGFGIWQLVEEGYDIQKDNWLRNQDKEFKHRLKEVKKVKQMILEQAEADKEQEVQEDKSSK